MSLEKSFFAQNTETVARDLLGAVISKDGIRCRIVETEAYPEKDPASHAHGGRTPRNTLMYETFGHIYIYICYGIHNMLNFTTEKENAGAVLIRAVEPLEGVEQMRVNRGIEENTNLCNGPGKVCEALEINKDLNGTKIGKKLKLENGRAEELEKSARIGISKAKDRKLRFYDPSSEYVSTQ